MKNPLDFYSTSILKSPKDAKVIISQRALLLNQKYKEYGISPQCIVPPAKCLSAASTYKQSTVDGNLIKNLIDPLDSFDYLSIGNISRLHTPLETWRNPVQLDNLDKHSRATFFQKEVKEGFKDNRISTIKSKSKKYQNIIYRHALTTNYRCSPALPKMKKKLPKKEKKRKQIKDMLFLSKKDRGKECFIKRISKDDDAEDVKMKKRVKEFMKGKNRITMNKAERFEPDIIKEDFEFYIQMMRETHSSRKLIKEFVKQPVFMGNYFSYQNSNHNDCLSTIAMELSNKSNEKIQKVLV